MDNRHQYFNEDNRLLNTLNEFMLEYNYTVRTSERRFHDNVASYIQLVQNTQNSINRQRRSPFPQNNNSIPNTNRYAFYARPFNDTLFTNIINDTVNHVLPGLFPDVQINATEEQINNATETYEYNSEDETHTNCPITLDPFQQNESVCRIVQCGHLFREQAIKNWFRQNVKCPVCRYDIRTNNPTSVGIDEEREPIAQETAGSLLQNLSSGLQNYLGRDSSMNNVFTFEIPLYIYNDLSGNYV